MIKPKWGFKRWFLNSLADRWKELFQVMQASWWYCVYVFCCFFFSSFFSIWFQMGNRISCVYSCIHVSIAASALPTPRPAWLLPKEKYEKTLTFIDIQIRQTQNKSNAILPTTKKQLSFSLSLFLACCFYFGWFELFSFVCC